MPTGATMWRSMRFKVCYTKHALSNKPQNKGRAHARGRLDHITAVVPDGNQPDILGPNVGFGAVDETIMWRHLQSTAQSDLGHQRLRLARDDHASLKADVVQVLGTSTSVTG